MISSSFSTSATSCFWISNGSSEVEEKRQLLNFLLQNLKLQGKNLVFELKTPFDTVLQVSKCSNLLCGQDSNLQPSGYTNP